MSWQNFIQQEMQQPYFQELDRFLKEEAKQHTIYPPKKEIFAAFDLTPLDEAKVVILGMDPYPNPNQAHGLAFSVRRGITIPPSLRNIFKELQNDLGIDAPTHGCLNAWATQGVLLLNAALTVRAKTPGSHQEVWKPFTDAVIRKLNEREVPVIFVLMGAFAKKKAELITNKRHLQIHTSHPSPMSANVGGFFGTKIFSRINDFLVKQELEPIYWN